MVFLLDPVSLGATVHVPAVNLGADNTGLGDDATSITLAGHEEEQDPMISLPDVHTEALTVG